MIVSLSIIITWFLGMILYYEKKQLLFISNFILYTFLNFLITNYTTIMSLNISRFTTTKNPFLFTAFILYRELILPFIAIIFANLFIHSHSKIKIATLSLTVLSMEWIDTLLTHYHIIRYINWSEYQQFLVNLLILAFSLMIATILLWIEKRERNHI